MKDHVLHITNWYPNRTNPFEAVFIQRHIAALAPHFRQTVWHLQVKAGQDKWAFQRSGEHAQRTWVLRAGTNRWRLIEWLSFLLVVLAWYRRDRNERYTLVNIHIAYPLAVQAGRLTKLFGLPVVITEHWSAYHFGFHGNSSGIDRIRRIFRQRLPLVVVSEALRQDIARFAGADQTPCAVVGNVIDREVFRPEPNTRPEEGRFLYVGGARMPKRPDVLVRAMAMLRDEGRSFQLRIVGGGARTDELKRLVLELGLEQSVIFLGTLTPQAIAAELHVAHALLHCSDYETFSAICAEAASSGTPVVASCVGGIPEFCTPELGILVDGNDAGTWHQVITGNWAKLLSMDRVSISASMGDRFSAARVGTRYADFLQAAMGHAPISP